MLPILLLCMLTYFACASEPKPYDQERTALRQELNALIKVCLGKHFFDGTLNVRLVLTTPSSQSGQPGNRTLK